MGFKESYEMLNETIESNLSKLEGEAKTGGPSFSPTDAFHLREAEKVRQREKNKVEKRSLG